MRPMRSCAVLCTVLALAGCKERVVTEERIITQQRFIEADGENWVDEEQLRPIVEWPSGCEILNVSSAPVLTMPRDREFEVFLPNEPTANGAVMAVDYMVQPWPRVLSAEIRFDFDIATPVPTVELPTECLRTIPMSHLTAHGVDNTVVRAEVVLNEANEAHRRRAYVSVARGDRTLLLNVPALPPDSGDEGWYLVFEPTTGERRIAMRWFSSVGATLQVSGLPRLSGVVALVRSEVLEVHENPQLIYAAYPFSHVWRYASSAWFGAFVRAEDSAATLVERRRADAVPLVAPDPATEQLTLTPDRSYVLLELGLYNDSGEVRVPCVPTRVVVDGDAVIQITGPNTSMSLEAGESATSIPTCASGEDTALLTWSGRSMSGRTSTILIVSEGA